MEIHVLNDLHIESADFEPPQTDAGVIVLAGDVLKMLTCSSILGWSWTQCGNRRN